MILLVYIYRINGRSIHSFGTSAVYVSDVKMTKDKQRIREGKFQVILMSPEALFSGTTWKHILSKVITTMLYRKIVLLKELHLIEVKELLTRGCSGFILLLYCFL